MTLNPHQIEYLQDSAQLIACDPQIQMAENWTEWANANIDRIESKGKKPLIHVERVLPIIWILKKSFDVPSRIVFKLMKEALEKQIVDMHADNEICIDYSSSARAFNGVLRELEPIHTVKRVMV